MNLSRTVSWVYSNPPNRKNSATSHRLILYLNRHNSTCYTIGCGQRQEVECCCCSFVELPLTLKTPIHLIPQFSFSLLCWVVWLEWQCGQLISCSLFYFTRHLFHPTRTGVLLASRVLTSDTFGFGTNTSRLRLESGQERLLPEIGLFANAAKRI